MNARCDALAAAALELVGRPFRLHGRDPATGLDCVGVVSAALTAIGTQPAAPTGYSLRNLSIAQWLPAARASGLVPARGAIEAGDILVIALPGCQHHLVIAADAASVIHAHAGLRRVVRQPLDATWRVEARWRPGPVSKG